MLALITRTRIVSLIVAIAAIAVVCAPSALVRAETYGGGLTLEEATPIAELLTDPEAWEGRRVRVEGTVSEVCPKKGCWMSLSGEGGSIRVKVEDDVVVFPASAVSRHAAAEGVVRVIDLDRERYAAWLEHLAEERGERFDPGSVGNGPYRLIQIQGEGAEIDL